MTSPDDGWEDWDDEADDWDDDDPQVGTAAYADVAPDRAPDPESSADVLLGRTGNPWTVVRPTRAVNSPSRVFVVSKTRVLGAYRTAGPGDEASLAVAARALFSANHATVPACL